MGIVLNDRKNEKSNTDDVGDLRKTFNEDGKIAGTIHENLGNKE